MPEQLLSQTEARQQARALNNESPTPGIAWIAHAVPLGSWGGHEKGWSVSAVPIAETKS